MFQNSSEYRYQKTIQSIAWALLVFLLLINLHGLFLYFANIFMGMWITSTVLFDIIYQTLYAAGYLFSFMFPVSILRSRMKNIGLSFLPMMSDFSLSPWLFFILFGGITLIWAQAYLNSALVSIFSYSGFSEEVLWSNGSTQQGYQIVLQFIVMCVVPAFCEEFLFRGAIMTNLLPFRRGTAVLVSSLLFGIMHQNAEQILYAFAAGLVLGAVYERTGSIWNCVFLHLMNNFSSLANQVISERIGGIPPQLVVVIFEGILFLIGVICIPVLVKLFSRRRDPLKNGFFGRSVPESSDYIPCRIAPKRQVRLFFTFPMVLFFCFCILQIVFLLGLAVWYGYFT